MVYTTEEETLMDYTVCYAIYGIYAIFIEMLIYIFLMISEFQNVMFELALRYATIDTIINYP